MNGIYYYLIAFVVIWVLALTLKNKLEKHGFEINFPVIMWKTQRLRGLITRISNKFPRFWKWYMNIGIIISFIAMVFITWSLVSSLATITDTPSVSLIIPGVEMPGSSIYVPFIYGLIALASVLIVHEFSHGILAIREKINIRSIGLLLFFILPGAFVEPDEEELNKAKKSAKLRIYAAGSMANITLAAVAILIVFLISSLAIPANFNENGIEINRIVTDSPSDGILKQGMILQSINGEKINDSDSYSNIVSTFSPGDKVEVGTSQGNYNVTLAENPNNHSVGYFGIQAAKHYELKNSNIFGDISWIYFYLLELFQWVFILNLGIGLFNLLPLKPLDGGLMFETLLSYKLSENHYKPVVNALSMVLVLIIIFSLVYGFL